MSHTIDIETMVWFLWKAKMPSSSLHFYFTIFYKSQFLCWSYCWVVSEAWVTWRAASSWGATLAQQQPTSADPKLIAAAPMASNFDIDVHQSINTLGLPLIDRFFKDLFSLSLKLLWTQHYLWWSNRNTLNIDWCTLYIDVNIGYLCQLQVSWSPVPGFHSLDLYWPASGSHCWGQVKM